MKTNKFVDKYEGFCMKNHMILLRIGDGFKKTMTYISSAFCVIVLFAIIGFILINGVERLSFKLISSDYSSINYSLKQEVKLDDSKIFKNPNIENSYFSDKYGIALIDDVDLEGNSIIKIVYIDDESIFHNLVNDKNQKIDVKTSYTISKIVATNDNNDYLYALSKDKANNMIETLQMSNQITDINIIYGGGGISGSIKATLYLILMTLLFAMPIGIISALYLNLYCKNEKLKNAIRTMIDMTAGVPSIIFGLVGAIIFIPMLNKIINSNGGSIMSGALTLTIILLPTVIKSVEEAILTVPQGYINSSLALGASSTQTMIKVVLPNCFGGILTALLLAISRIIGESAALMYAIGTVINDKIYLNGKGTSLAVHIYRIMGGENPNIKVSCAIALIILIMVFILNLSVKIITKNISKKGK